MNRIIAIGVLFLSRLSFGLNEELCCLRKQVGDLSYNYIASEATSQYSCKSDCVYSQEGDPIPGNRYCFANGKLQSECQDSSDELRATHAFYSGLSSFLSKLKSSLPKEQVHSVLCPAPCSPVCKHPSYCWHGKCKKNDDPVIPPGSYSHYIKSIKEHSKLVHMPNIFKALLDACSPARIECYGKCLPTILDALAKCFQLHWWEIPGCVENAITKIEKECSACVCDLVFLIFPNLKWLIQGLGLCIPIPKPELVGRSCDRDCASTGPKTCVFNFTLESVKTDTDGRRADGRLRSVLAFNGQLPGPPIVICEGDTLVVNFENDISGNMTNADGSTNTTTLHFHGIREKSRPWSDGVPFVSQCPILPGDPSWKTHPYGFNTDVDGAPPGTYWYHSHVGSQRTNGAYGALIIKDKGSNPGYPDIDVDAASNTLVLQEWYESATHQTPVSILINGNGRVGSKKHSGGDDEILSFLQGKGGNFKLVDNPDYTGNFTTKYSEFNVDKSKTYRFRIIGAISQNFPLQVSIEDHTFTAIAADSLNIQRVENLTNVWLAAGERYDIVVQTKTSVQDQPYKIKVFGYTNINNKSSSPICTVAWLRYPGQTINYTYVTPSDCSDFEQSPSGRTLNPVPNNYEEWIGSPENGLIFIKDIKSIKNESTIDLDHLANLNTHYIEFAGNITFNNKRMEYPHVPFLLQDPENITGRCGSKCDAHVGRTGSIPFLYTNCTELNCTRGPSDEDEYCKCQHVIQQPWAPGYWAETVLINNYLDHTAAHPIHQHGGWYWVVGMGKYPYEINRTFIMEQDNIGNLSRSFNYAPPKDTLQIPQNGYAIIRTKLDNAGAWIFHCHINFHVEIGMAMVLQIGELGKDQESGQNWCTGQLEKNSPCETPPPPPGGGPAFINWFYGMEPATRCVKPGTTVTWLWHALDHNVNIVNKTEHLDCTYRNSTPYRGDHVWTAPTEITGTSEDFYFACGRDNGTHCEHGMKAVVKVSNVHC